MTPSSNRTLTALFDRREDALKAVEELVRVGIPRSAVRVTPEADVAGTSSTSYDTSKDEKGFWASLADFFMPEEDRYTYAEAMHRGSILVSAVVTGSLADKAEDILEQYGTVNVAEREDAWRKEGWTGYRGGMKAGSSLSQAGTSGPSIQGGSPRQQVLPEVEERLRVGKRQVNSGRVRVRSYVVETPVAEQVNLHSEAVHVERRPADRSALVGEDAFRERTIEAVATSEEPVVAKEARVTGEVVVKKDSADRTETVTDKVRSTKIEVEDDRRQQRPAAARR